MGRCFQFGVSASPSGRKMRPDVGGVVLARVEVDVVGDLDRQVHGDVADRDEVWLHAVAVSLVGEQLGEPGAGRGPGRAAVGEEGVEARLEPDVAGLHAGLLRGGAGVEHAVADAHADPRRVPGVEKTP